MKWILIILAIIAGIVALVVIIGAFLPKGHVAVRSAKYKKSPEEIWDTITDFVSAPTWRTDLKSVEKLPEREGHAIWVEISKHGRMPFQVVEIDPPNWMVTRIADDTLPFGGSWTYEISATEGGSTLTITENGEIYNPIFRFMARFFFGYHATIESYLKNLGNHFGEEVEIIKPTNGRIK